LNGDIVGSVSFDGTQNVAIETSYNGIVPVEKGGTGTSSLAQNKLLVGNGTDQILTPTELHWDSENKRLGINDTEPT